MTYGIHFTTVAPMYGPEFILTAAEREKMLSEPPAKQSREFYDQWFKDDYEMWLAWLPKRDGKSDFERALENLQKHCPLAKPVVIERWPKSWSDAFGEFRCGLPDSFLILIRNTLSELESIDILIHEWAHGLTWRPAPVTAPWQCMPAPLHGDEWGVAYARAYRAAIEEDGTKDIDSFVNACLCGMCGSRSNAGFDVSPGTKPGEYVMKCRKCSLETRTFWISS